MPRPRHDVPEEFYEYRRDTARAIGSRIRQRRLRLGSTQDQVRERMELYSVSMTRAQFSRIENGELVLDVVQIIALAEVLGVTLDWVLLGKEES